MMRKALLALSMLVALLSSCKSRSVDANGYSYVDLGLSVMWASCNLEATSVEDYGGLYAWGETSGKEVFSKEAYPYYVDGLDQLRPTTNKYNSTDGLRGLEAADDAASVIRGGGWRIPTANEAAELIKKCTWELVNVNGVKCYKVTGPSGAYIILPWAGFNPGPGRMGQKNNCIYWTSTLSDDQEFAYFLYATDPKDMGIADDHRYFGYPIRPVI